MESAMNAGDDPPIYTIDLSLPPAQRYVAVATIYRDQLRSLTGLFDELVLSVLPEIYLPRIKTIARLFLRRVYSNEETEEIRGISKATGIEMYLLVSLNVFLDLLMGCTSGAVLSKDPTTEQGDEISTNLNPPRLLHFRTLDWGMPELRKILVRFEFIRSPDTATILATNISYIGFVGVLTGVRKGLSISLNFRPYHNGNSLFNQVRYYGSHVLVLLGLRRSISSVLRQFIIPPAARKPPGWLSWLSYLGWLHRRTRTRPQPHQFPITKTVSTLLRTPSTAAYLILCDGKSVYVLEKDHRTTVTESSDSFLVATNSDRTTQLPQTPTTPTSGEAQRHSGASIGTGIDVSLDEFIKDSVERRDCLQAHWDMKVARARQNARLRASGNNSPNARRDPLGRTRSSQRQSVDVAAATSSAVSAGSIASRPPDPEVTASQEEIITWTTMYPTTNEMTHFSTIMDPTQGTVTWIRRYPEPLPFLWGGEDFD